VSAEAELEAFLARDKLSDEELDRAFAIVMDGEAAPAQIMPFLLASIPLMNNPRALAAGARVMRERMIPVRAPVGAIDVCGTGGDGTHTLNISTAVSFVLAGAGVPVAKHGNRAMSSKSGAADVLEALGVKLTSDIPTLERALTEANVAFLFAQNHHLAMRHVAAARRELGRRTIFNLLGPLSNPAGVKRQLVGVFGGDFVRPMAEALSLLGVERALMIHGAGGLDELSPAGESQIADIRANGPIAMRVLRPIDFGLTEYPLEAIRGGDASVNATALLRLLDGEPGAYRDTVVLNAAAALIIAGKADGPRDAAEIAIASLDDGDAYAALNKLVAITNS
jgi:anthranilate phosphoribosyltransferase